MAAVRDGSVESSSDMSLRLGFRGSMVGAVLGDCLGKPWEISSWNRTVPMDTIEPKIARRVTNSEANEKPLRYTDDSAMTLALASSIVECKGFNIRDVAKKFQEEYHREPHRGYGMSVTTVFDKLRFDPEDVLRPAREQFDGKGSYGNGSAMRISPVALLATDEESLVKAARESSSITHAHKSAVSGGILQAFAVRKALNSFQTKIDPIDFVKYLLEQMEKYEIFTPKERDGTGKDIPSYRTQLTKLKEFLMQNEPPTQEEVMKAIGNGIMAVEAVPCAIYAFLHSADKDFAAAIIYAISLGGDTDTIASMAGAIAGAYWGTKGMPESWMKVCEATDKAERLADAICDLVHPSQKEDK